METPAHRRFASDLVRLTCALDGSRAPELVEALSPAQAARARALLRDHGKESPELRRLRLVEAFGPSASAHARVRRLLRELPQRLRQACLAQLPAYLRPPGEPAPAVPGAATVVALSTRLVRETLG